MPPTNAGLVAELFLSVDAIKSHLRAPFDAFELGSVPASQKRAVLVERALSAGVVSKRDLEGVSGSPAVAVRAAAGGGGSGRPDPRLRANEARRAVAGRN